MENKFGLIFLGIIGVLAIGGLITEFRDVTGQYYASGGGRYYYGPQKIHLQPDEACIYSGLQPIYPVQVYTNQFGTLMSLCDYNGQKVGVPTVQTALVQ